jgi:hypothetical protein
MIPQTLSQARKMIDALKARIISKPEEFTIMNMSAEKCLEIAGKAKKSGTSVLDALVAEYKAEQDLIERNGQAPSASACTPTATAAAPRPPVKAPSPAATTRPTPARQPAPAARPAVTPAKATSLIEQLADDDTDDGPQDPLELLGGN